MTEAIGAALRRGAALLAVAGIDDALREARLLLAHALGVGLEGVLDRQALVETKAYDCLLARRASREPMAFIRGRQGFWTLDLAVSPVTLIPRADTETLIEALCATVKQPSSVRSVLDLGTGTGALLLAALVEFPEAFGIGVDQVREAVLLASLNARTCGLADRAMFAVGDWSAAIGGQFDVVLSNPPYIRTSEIVALMPEVATQEPRAALDGGGDGLDAYRRIIPALPALLKPSGVAIVEIGADQGDAVTALAREAGFDDPRLGRDLGGNARALTMHRQRM